MKSVEKLFLSLMMIGMLVSTALAQEATISSQFIPPFDRPLEEYKDQITLTFTVPRNRVSGFLSISIFNDDRSITVTSKRPGRKPVALDPGVTILTGSDLDDLLDVSRLDFTGVDPTETFFDNGLPPGRYNLCFQLYNGRNEPVSNSACTIFNIVRSPVSGSMVFVPPFNVPFDAYSEQVTVTFITRSSFNALLELTVASDDGSIALKKQMQVTLESGSNIFNGSSLEPLFSPGGFLTLKGITENRLFGTGLSQGNYLMSFSLFADNVSIATARQQFSVPVSPIAMRVNVNPSFDVPLEELLSQTTLTLSASRNIQDAYVTLVITGDRVLIESDPAAVNERITLESNVPEMISARDLIEITGAGVRFEGVTAVDAITHGLPEGNYSYCFRFWDSDGQLLIEEPSCSSLNVPETTISLSVSAMPPYITIVEDMYNMLMVTATVSRKVSIGFTLSIEGDNGISITGKRSDTHDR